MDRLGIPLAVFSPSPLGRVSMPGRQAPAVHVTARQEELLRKLVRGTTIPQRLAVRAQIVLLLAAAGHSSEQIVGKLVVTRPMVRKWRRRWSASQDQLRVVEGEESDSAVQSRICEILADAPRAVVRPTSAQSRSSKLSPSPAKIPKPRSDRSATGHPERWPASLCAEGLSRASPPDLWIVF